MKIYALKYAGPFTSKLAMLLWMEGWDQDAERNYYIWAIKGKGEVVVVDTGCRVALANERKLCNFVNPVEMLARIDVHAGNVKKVIITHIHFDHAGGVEAFFRDDNPSALITDMVAWMESYDKLRSKAPFELLFPGHDEDLLTKYPHVAKDVARLA